MYPKSKIKLKAKNWSELNIIVKGFVFYYEKKKKNKKKKTEYIWFFKNQLNNDKSLLCKVPCLKLLKDESTVILCMWKNEDIVMFA